MNHFDKDNESVNDIEYSEAFIKRYKDIVENGYKISML